MTVRLCLAMCAASLLPARVAPVSAQEARLGSIGFETSGAADAQPHFLRGVLLLHSFEYEDAARAFRRAQELDSDFAMAYWGEAMTYNHPVWNEQEAEAARAVLNRLGGTAESRAATAHTERERGFLAAVEALYGDGTKPARDTAYAFAMQRHAERFPDDHEVQSFYALALLGLSRGVRDFSTYMRAAAIVENVFRENPGHPGAVHYLIHSYDDPIHAPLGLRAARAYSRVAPDAAHAQHMTSHIFLAMGMWDDVVSQNVIAAELTGWGPGHYTVWLGYALQQQGKPDAALRHLRRAREHLGENPSVRRRGALAYMRAAYVVDTERWADSVLQWEMDVSDGSPVARAVDAFALGYAAYRGGDRATADAQLARLTAIRGASAVPGVLERELRAVLLLADGDADAARALLAEATEIEDGLPMEFGPPDIVKPSHELLGEVLLELGRAREAQREFEQALRLAPRRALALRGLSRAAFAAGDRKVAARAHAQLREIWHEAEVPVPDMIGGG